MSGFAGQRSGWLLPRHPGDAARVAVAVAVLVVTAASVHRDRVGTTETNLFRLLNDLPAAATLLLWPVMQLGNIVAVPVVALLAVGFRRFRLAAELAVAGVGVWSLAKVVKKLVVRGRPQTLLPGVHIHGPAAAGSGYPSGHAAVAFALVTLLSPYLGRRGRRVLWLAAFLVCLARLYVGAHLPLDVVGGAALGWGIGSAVNLLLGAPSGRPSLPGLRRALRKRGLAAASLYPVDVDRRRSARFSLTTAEGLRLFVKVVPREPRDSDLFYRAWRGILRRGSTPKQGGTPAQQAYREAMLTLLARGCGARVPDVIAVDSYGNGSGLLIQPWVAGVPLDEVDVDATILSDVWQQVACLQAARLAHGDLRPGNLLVDREGHVWLVDFGRAAAPADAAQLRGDISDLLRTLGPLSEPSAAEDAAREALSTERFEAALVEPQG